MKYLKLFDTTAQYDTFKSSSDFVLPNVSYVINENVYFNPSEDIKEIEFYVQGKKYTALKDMTWREFIYSPYNIDGWYETMIGTGSDEECVGISYEDNWMGGGIEIQLSKSDDYESVCFLHEKIIENYEYTTFEISY
jgi:hypothetical protein